MGVGVGFGLGFKVVVLGLVVVADVLGVVDSCVVVVFWVDGGSVVVVVLCEGVISSLWDSAVPSAGLTQSGAPATPLLW